MPDVRSGTASTGSIRSTAQSPWYAAHPRPPSLTPRFPPAWSLDLRTLSLEYARYDTGPENRRELTAARSARRSRTPRPVAAKRRRWSTDPAQQPTPPREPEQQGQNRISYRQ